MPKTYYIPDVYSGCIAWYNFRKGRQAEKKSTKRTISVIIFLLSQSYN